MPAIWSSGWAAFLGQFWGKSRGVLRVNEVVFKEMVMEKMRKNTGVARLSRDAA